MELFADVFVSEAGVEQVRERVGFFDWGVIGVVEVGGQCVYEVVVCGGVGVDEDGDFGEAGGEGRVVVALVVDEFVFVIGVGGVHEQWL